jgi:ribosome biogenesis GTPase
MHRQEPGCGLRQAVERGAIAAQRYRLYEEIVGELTAR